jgi:hypothetical protein
MGVNLDSLHRTPGPPGSPGCRSTPRRRVLFVDMYKVGGQSAKVQKSSQARSKSLENLFNQVDHDFRRIMKLVS